MISMTCSRFYLLTKYHHQKLFKVETSLSVTTPDTTVVVSYPPLHCKRLWAIEKRDINIMKYYCYYYLPCSDHRALLISKLD